MWCNPVITSGAYTKPNTAANSHFTEEFKPAHTIFEIQSPTTHPIGPNTVCANITANNNEKNGTVIIEI